MNKWTQPAERLSEKRCATGECIEAVFTIGDNDNRACLVKTKGGGIMRVMSIGLVFVLLVGFGLTGCAKRTTIELQFAPTGINLEPCPGTIAVVELADKRTRSAIGVTHDGTQFFASTSATAWVSRALADELTAGGCEVQLHQRMMAFDTDFVVTGDLEEVFVTQSSMTNYTAAMRLRIVATSGGNNVFRKTFTSTFDQTTAPSPGVNVRALSRLLQGMMRELLPELRDGLRR